MLVKGATGVTWSSWRIRFSHEVSFTKLGSVELTEVCLCSNGARQSDCDWASPSQCVALYLSCNKAPIEARVLFYWHLLLIFIIKLTNSKIFRHGMPSILHISIRKMVKNIFDHKYSHFNTVLLGHKLVSEWVSEWAIEWMGGWVRKWWSEWVNEWIRQWISERLSLMCFRCPGALTLWWQTIDTYTIKVPVFYLCGPQSRSSLFGNHSARFWRGGLFGRSVIICHHSERQVPVIIWCWLVYWRICSAAPL